MRVFVAAITALAASHLGLQKNGERGVTVLVDAAGRRHVPLAWEGAPPGGHHREGVLQIQRAGEPAARSFRWQLP